MKRLILIVASLPVVAQTQVDLRTQAKPPRTGTTLPATCVAGDLFLNTAAAAGSNLYGCLSANTWVLQAGGGSGGGPGTLTVEANGVTVGSRGTQNFVAGSGVLNALADTGTLISIQSSADTGVMLSRTTEQSGADLLCASASGSATTYSCSMSPTLQAYTTGMLLRWKPDVSGAGSPVSLNVDTLGALPVKQFDGVTDPAAADINAGQMYPVWYDGSVFRLAIPPLNAATLAVQPVCNSAQRGRLWQTLGGSGVKDSLSVCAKDATDTFAWRSLY